VTRISLEAVGPETRLRLRRQAVGQDVSDRDGCPPLEPGLLTLRQVLEARSSA
jgi:hypothetical protein